MVDLVTSDDPMMVPHATKMHVDSIIAGFTSGRKVTLGELSFVKRQLEADLNRQSIVWRHKESQALYEIVCIGFNATHDEIEVRYVPRREDRMAADIPWSREYSQFVEKFEPVVQQSVWVPVRPVDQPEQGQ